MNKELIIKLIDRARESSDNAYCPYTNFPMGCALLVDVNIIFTGCNIESRALSCSASAGEVAVHKAISEGHTSFKAICFYSTDVMPFPDGRIRDLLSEFSPMIDIIVAQGEDYSLHTLYELFPFQPEGPKIE